MMNEQPLVSVLMTSYNREKYIGEAIESVLASTYQNFELIIVDDASQDKTVEIAQKYKSKDSRIKIYVNESNLGDYSNRNKAATYATGTYLKYVDSDDTIYNWGLEYCVELMRKYPEAGMGIFRASNKVDEEYLNSNIAVNKHFFENTFLNIGPSGTILNRSLFIKAGFFKADYGAASDMYFNIKMASLFPVVMLKKEFFFYREHEGQEIKNKNSYLFFNYPYMRDILQLPELPISEDEKVRLLANAKKSLVMDCFRSIKNFRQLKPAFKAYKLSGLKLTDILKVIFT